ncbi:MAG: FkbM family methyltransferase [Mycobacterium sp.]
MQVGGRDLAKIAHAVVARRNYVAAINMVRLYDHPVNMLHRYLTRSGEYPATFPVRTPQSDIDLTLYSPDDLLTLNEIFCRNDYLADISDKVIVDFGSNIGVSAAYFLTRNASAFAYLFEPLPTNIARLRDNLRPFDGRYDLQEVAVGTAEGDVEFCWEESGRYGGVNRAGLSHSLTVPCVNSRTVLENVVAEHGRIDVLKVDIEGLEQAVIANIPVELARKIKKLYVEEIFETNPLAQTHSLVHYGGIAQFHLLDSQSA